MAISFVQGNKGGIQSGPSAGVAYSSNNAAGNLLVLVCRGSGGAPAAVSVSDSQGNSWSVTTNNLWVGGNKIVMAYAPNCKAGANTVTVSITGASFLQTKIAEYSGVLKVSPLDKSNDTNGSSTTPTSPSVTTTKNGELIIGGFANATTNSATITAGSGYTKRATTDDGNGAIEDRVQASAGAITAGWTTNPSVNWDAGIMTFFADTGVPNSLMMMGCGT